MEIRPVTKNGKKLPDDEFVDNPEELVRFIHIESICCAFATNMENDMFG